MLPDASNLGEFGLGYCLGRRGTWYDYHWGRFVTFIFRGDFTHLLGGFETFILHGFGVQGWVVVSTFFFLNFKT